MRVTQRQIAVLRSAVARHFGRDTRIWLFGSRVDDACRGGDYDFYLEVTLSDPAEIIDRKLRLLAELHGSREFEDEKIDLVIRPLADWSQDLPVYWVARSEGIAL